MSFHFHWLLPPRPSVSGVIDMALRRSLEYDPRRPPGMQTDKSERSNFRLRQASSHEGSSHAWSPRGVRSPAASSAREEPGAPCQDAQFASWLQLLYARSSSSSSVLLPLRYGDASVLRGCLLPEEHVSVSETGSLVVVSEHCSPAAKEMIEFDPPDMLSAPLTKLFLQAKQLCIKLHHIQQKGIIPKG